MSKRMVTYKVDGDDKIASIDGHELGSGGVGDKSISRRMITYKVDDTGKITSIDGHELNGGGGGNYQIKPLEVTQNGVYDVVGEAYKPVRVNVPQTVQSGSVKALLDATKSAYHLFYEYKGTSVDGLIGGNDTSNVTNMRFVFSDSYNLTSIPPLDASKATEMTSIFSGCSKLTSIGLYGFTRSIDISGTALGHDAIVAFLNQAGAAYNSSQKITMGSDKLALLSDEEKAIATNKGWQLA